ncbi:MAG: CxxxxCH/CxxCH domain-containing protein, partial [Myxococcota bacterium]
MRQLPRLCQVVWLLAACADLRETPTPEECSACHGGEGGAPPPDLSGSIDTSRRGVGAHAAHLASPALGRPVACATCHVVPESERDVGHLDRTAEELGTPADVTFSGLARANGFAARYDPETLRCESTWCHGRRGGEFNAPEWTLVDQSQIRCDGCHGAPPPDPHPTSDRCWNCHPGVEKDEDGKLALADGKRHIDGVVDVTPAEGCNACHGDADGEKEDEAAWAPPTSIAGLSVTTTRGVGAHQSHVRPEGSARPVACEACHVLPLEKDSETGAYVGNPLAEGHIDSALPAEVTFSGLARAEDASPLWDGESCTNVYCHGATLAGGAATAPDWTLVDESQRQCDSCHGYPPPPPHPEWDRCDRCHPDADGEGGIADASRHV